MLIYIIYVLYTVLITTHIKRWMTQNMSPLMIVTIIVTQVLLSRGECSTAYISLRASWLHRPSQSKLNYIVLSNCCDRYSSCTSFTSVYMYYHKTCSQVRLELLTDFFYPYLWRSRVVYVCMYVFGQWQLLYFFLECR